MRLEGKGTSELNIRSQQSNRMVRYFHFTAKSDSSAVYKCFD